MSAVILPGPKGSALKGFARQEFSVESETSASVDHGERVEGLVAHIAKLKAQKKVLYGVEALNLRRINKEIRQRTAELKKLKAGKKNAELSLAEERKFEKRRKSLTGKYHRLSLEGLRWRNKQGWPRLAVFSLSSPTMKFVSQRRNRYSEFSPISVNRNTEHQAISPRLPAAVRECFQDVLQRLKRKRVARERKVSHPIVSLTATFSGIIPNEAREKIEAATVDFKKEEIFIIAEPTAWRLNTSTPIQVDPLVVGHDGFGGLWLITDFDTTSVEDLAFFATPGEEKAPAKRKRRKSK